MYDIFKDLQKLADESMDVIECHFWLNGDIEIVGERDGKIVRINYKGSESKVIPDCYEAYRQEEQRQKAWDEYFEKLPECCICGHKIIEGNEVHVSHGKAVCSGCMEELTEQETVFRMEVD